MGNHNRNDHFVFDRMDSSVIPLVQKLNFGGFGVELKQAKEDLKEVKNEMKQVQEGLEENEIAKEKDQGFGDLKVDPYSIRLNYQKQNDNRIKVWLGAPADFLNTQVEKVIYDRREGGKLSRTEVSNPPTKFATTFKCPTAFTIRAEIKVKNGKTLKRRKYIALDELDAGLAESDEPDNDTDNFNAVP